MEINYYSIISKNLLRLRSFYNFTQSDIEKKTGIPRTHISRYESAKGSIPTIPTLLKFAKVYRCSILNLLDASFDPFSLSKVAEPKAPFTSKSGPPIFSQLLESPELLAKLDKLFKSHNKENITKFLDIISDLSIDKLQALLKLLTK